MLEWKDAAPLIGVITTAFLGTIGIIIANWVKGQATSAASSAPAVLTATALAKEGGSQDVALAVAGVSAVLTSQFVTTEKRLRERDEERNEMLREHHAERLAELRRIRLAMEK
jgi:hypothetical protein